MKTILLTILLCFITPHHSEPTKIGSFTIYITNEHEFLVEYSGKIDECYSKYIIDKLFIECDTINKLSGLDTLNLIGPARNVTPINKTRL